MNKKDLRRLCDALFVAVIGAFITYHAAHSPQNADKAEAVTVPGRFHDEAITSVWFDEIGKGEAVTLRILDETSGATLTVLHGYSGQEITTMPGYNNLFFPAVHIPEGYVQINKQAIAQAHGLTGLNAVPMRVEVTAGRERRTIARLPIVSPFEIDNQ